LTKVLLFGVGPLPFYKNDYVSGIGTGSWQLALPLLRQGHQVLLITGEFGVHEQPKVEYTTPPQVFGKLYHLPVPEPLPERLDGLREAIMPVIEKFDPDCIITASSPVASQLALHCDLKLPTWIDMHGDIMTEIQAKLPHTDGDQLSFFHRHMGRMLRRGDVFSAVSGRQRLATIGQLSMMGRLNRHTLGYEFVYTKPIGIDAEYEYVHDKNVLRGPVVGPLEFVILWSGGFNTWVDVDTLFKGLELAMEKNPLIHFAATGGGLPGHHTEGYEVFMRNVENSKHKERFHLLGWIPYSDLHNTYLESDLGINVDLPVYESTMGARTRFLSWMVAGLPIATTQTTEISMELASQEVAFDLPLKDAEGMAERLVELSLDKARCHKVGLAGKTYAFEHFSFEATTKPMLDWADNPTFAPDHRDGAKETSALDRKLDAMLGTAAPPHTISPQQRKRSLTIWERIFRKQI
jgi:glycosyltransferase involved in cell wall biosynthesis